MTDRKRTIERHKSTTHKRGFTLSRDDSAIDVENRTVELAFSSETPVRRWFGDEILGHSNGEVDLTRFEDGAAVLVGHNLDDHVGVVERAWIDGDVGRAVVRFGSTERASEVFQNVQDGIWRHVSVGYAVRDMVLAEQREEGADSYRVTDWQPFEVSLVSVPADVSVGVGREFALEDEPSEDEVAIVERAKAEATAETETREALPEISNTPTEDLKMDDDKKVDDGVEVRAAEDAARKAERQRVADLLATGARFQADDLARQFIENGKGVDELNKAILERQGVELEEAESAEIGMTDDEVREFSFVRLINALGQQGDAKAQREASFELAVVAEAAAHHKRDVRGALIPFDVLSRAHTVGTPAAGGNLVENELLGGSFIESLENALALVQCGITTLNGLTGNIAIPRQNGGASHFWIAENGTPSESSATFDQIAMSPKTVGAYTEISRRMLLQPVVSAEAFVRSELILRLALAIDAAGINGSGASNEPLGIMQYPGVGVVPLGTNGGAPTWDSVVDLETGVAAANAAMGNLCYLTNARMRGKFKRTFIDAGSGERIWDTRSPETPVNGYRTVVSNQVPSDLTKGTGTNLSGAIFGNFADFILGFWSGVDLQVNPYSLDTAGAVRITAFQDLDMQLRHPESFNIINDGITT